MQEAAAETDEPDEDGQQGGDYNDDDTSSLGDDEDLDGDDSLDREVRVEVLSVPGYVLQLTLHPHPNHKGAAKSIRVKLLKAPSGKGDGSSTGTDTSGSYEEPTEIGYLEGFLLERPNDLFFKVSDSISQELQELSVMFCNAEGRADRVHHEKLTTYPSTLLGGFLQIYKVEIHPAHQKLDLGLWLVHETLAFVQNEFTLAVMVPCPLSRHERVWGRDGLPEDPFQNEESRNRCAENEVKVRRHFARMGFHQAGRTRRLATSFFLARDGYFQGEQPSRAIENWVRKPDAHKIDVYVPPSKPTPTGLDRQLALALHLGESTSAVVRAIEDLLARGASIENAKAVHIAAANSALGPPILRTLSRLGADMNQEDEDGNTPLHVAAGCIEPLAIETLLELGADASLVNHEGHTPLQTLELQEQSTNDLTAAMNLTGSQVPEDLYAKRHKSMLLIMPEATRGLLQENWMSPRMKILLLETAQILSEADNAEVQNLMQRHLPVSILTRFQARGLPDYFVIGVSMCFEAVASVLRMGLPPTVTRVRNMIYSSSRGVDHFHRMIDANGKVEYALDALFRAVEDAIKGRGGDLVNYESFQHLVLAQPPTPVDLSLDLGFLMCVYRGGGLRVPRGPWNPDSEALLPRSNQGQDCGFPAGVPATLLASLLGLQ